MRQSQGERAGVGHVRLMHRACCLLTRFDLAPSPLLAKLGPHSDRCYRSSEIAADFCCRLDVGLARLKFKSPRQCMARKSEATLFVQDDDDDDDNGHGPLRTLNGLGKAGIGRAPGRGKRVALRGRAERGAGPGRHVARLSGQTRQLPRTLCNFPVPPPITRHFTAARGGRPRTDTTRECHRCGSLVQWRSRDLRCWSMRDQSSFQGAFRSNRKRSEGAPRIGHSPGPAGSR